MRESYRLNKHTLVQKVIENRRSLDIVFMFTSSRSPSPGKMTFGEINAAMQKLVTSASILRGG